MEKVIATSGITIVKSKPALNNSNNTIGAGADGDLSRFLSVEGGKAHVPNEAVKPAYVPTGPRVSEDEIRVCSLDEYEGAAQCLAEAFAEDLVARYFVDTPDRADWSEEEKWNLHVQILEYVTYAHLLKGLVTTVGPDYGAVALWMPPGHNMDDLLTIFRSGMWRLNYQLSPEGKKRFFTEFLPLLHDTKSYVMGARDDESWYLVYIGTKPSARGKGYAKKLITHVTDMCDREGRACYLESSNPANPAIYRKYGFEGKKVIHLQRAEDDIQLEIMVREPESMADEKSEVM